MTIFFFVKLKKASAISLTLFSTRGDRITVGVFYEVGHLLSQMQGAELIIGIERDRLVWLSLKCRRPIASAWVTMKETLPFPLATQIHANRQSQTMSDDTCNTSHSYQRRPSFHLDFGVTVKS